MELFKGQSLLEFTERFKTDLDCEEYLASFNKFIKRIVERSPVSQSQLVCNEIDTSIKKFCVFQKKVVLLQRYKKEKGSKELRPPAACPLISDFK